MCTPVETALTHGGRFHADDVFSSALLEILNPQVSITRAFRVPEDFDGLVFDIGGGPFDHHTAPRAARENGVPYAAFGLLWRTFGPSLVGEAAAAKFDEDFIQPLDLDDNTGCGNLLAGAIGAFNPVWDSEENADAAFLEAVSFAKALLERQLEGLRAAGRAKSLVRAAAAQMKNGIVTLPRYAPWKATLSETSALFVVYPSQRGGFSAQVVPDGDGEARCPFPLAWAGRSEAELPFLSGIPGLRFCHPARFLIAAETLEGAFAACALAREIHESLEGV